MGGITNWQATSSRRWIQKLTGDVGASPALSYRRAVRPMAGGVPLDGPPAQPQVRARSLGGTDASASYSSEVSTQDSNSITPSSVNLVRSQPSAASRRPSFLQLGTI